MAPGVFYYVHIDVELDQIDDYSTEESDSETSSSSESESSAALQEPDNDVELDQVQDCLTQEVDYEDQVEEETVSDTSAGTESSQDIPPKKARWSL